MSGGTFNYDQYRINEIASSIDRKIYENEKTKEYSQETIEQFKVASIHLKFAFMYTHRIDWLLSGDDSEESFHQRLEEDFQKIMEDLE